MVKFFSILSKLNSFFILIQIDLKLLTDLKIQFPLGLKWKRLWKGNANESANAFAKKKMLKLQFIGNLFFTFQVY